MAKEVATNTENPLEIYTDKISEKLENEEVLDETVTIWDSLFDIPTGVIFPTHRSHRTIKIDENDDDEDAVADWTIVPSITIPLMISLSESNRSQIKNFPKSIFQPGISVA